MTDIGDLRIALCQTEVVQGCPSASERAISHLLKRAKSTGANLAVFPSESPECKPRVFGLNGAVVANEGDRAEVALGDEMFEISLGYEADGADFAIFSDWTPWTLVGARSSKTEESPHMPVLHVNPVGISNAGKAVCAYDGASRLVLPGKGTVAQLRDDFTGDYAPVTLDKGGAIAKPCDMKALRAIVSSIRRFDAYVMPWHPNWVIGLSGGLDSSVVASLLVMALGPSRVKGFGLSSRFNTDATKSNAHRVAEALGIEFTSGSIEKLVDATDETARDFGFEPLEGLVLENVQARVRGHLLSTFAALCNGVVANNGNRVEAALGYATLYGDAVGALAPIADLTKVQLFEIAHEINGVYEREIVPENLLPVVTENGMTWETMPSAELSSGQKDPMKWFYHDWLVSTLLDECDGDPCAIMTGYLESRLQDTQAGKWIAYYGLDDPKAFVEDLEWVLSSMRRAAFKRIQACPAIRLASTSSIDQTPEPQGDSEPTKEYLALRSQILSLV